MKYECKVERLCRSKAVRPNLRLLETDSSVLNIEFYSITSVFQQHQPVTKDVCFFLFFLMTLKVVKNPDAPHGVTITGVTGEANIIEKDIIACKSIVHVIDTVLLPVKTNGFKQQGQIEGEPER